MSESAMTLNEIAAETGLKIESKEFARAVDERDSIRHLKEDFIIPTKEDSDEEIIYFATNRLGLQPKKAKSLVSEVVESWANNVVECHFVQPLPAGTCEEYVVDQLARLIGARSREEVVAMNDVYVNLHLMLVSFYRPNSTRHKILFDSESKYLPIPESHIRSHGQSATESLISVPCAPDNEIMNMTDIIKVIEEEGDSIATILLPGALPRTGQLLDLEKITQAGHRKGCMVGFILDDVVGNVEIKLNKWKVDFACWETGKYLNSGPYSMGCAFLHENHSKNDLPKFTGWWGHRFSTRFEMSNSLERSPGINGYKLSNEPPLKIAQIKASLDVYDKTSIQAIHRKSVLLTGYLEYLLRKKSSNITIVTPSNAAERGAQLSIKVTKDVKQVCANLKKNGIICSYALPDIITLCPAPLYCSFVDVFTVAHVFTEIIS